MVYNKTISITEASLWICLRLYPNFREIKEKLGDILFEIVLNAKTTAHYRYIEPSTLEEIKNLRKSTQLPNSVNKEFLESKIHGA